MIYSLGVFRFSLHIHANLASSLKIENEMKEIETYAVYQRQIVLSRDALEATPSPYIR
jgi:hypothetical protein